MFGWLTNTVAPEPMALDHLPLNVANEPKVESNADPVGKGLTHTEKLELAAQRLGRPFKCAADGLPRLVTRDGIDVTVGVPPAPAPAPEPSPNVTTIGRKARA